MQDEGWKVYRATRFRTHLGATCLEFAARGQIEAERKLAAYLDQHGIHAPQATCRLVEE
jgi:hypothetical protein